MKTLLYYTSTPFLDISVEIINILKKQFKLHVLIEVTPGLKKTNIVDIENLPEDKTFISPYELLNEDLIRYLEPYFSGSASVNFIVHPHDTGISFSTISVSYKTWKFLKSIKPDIIHLETFSLRSIGLMPFLVSSNNLFVAIHDPKPHSGENSWKVQMARFLLFFLSSPKGFFLYSLFSKLQFDKEYKRLKAPKFILKMNPYTFYSKVYYKESETRNHILFFGRISMYKGVDVLMKSIPSVLEEYPDELFTIAGQKSANYTINNQVSGEHKRNVVFLERYIPTMELVNLIKSAKVVVCPYLDATQSGVLMTAFSLDTPVIASDVGAFSEYIENNVNGMLFPAGNSFELTKRIKAVLQNNFYSVMQENLKGKNKRNLWENTKSTLINSYYSTPV